MSSPDEFKFFEHTKLSFFVNNLLLFEILFSKFWPTISWPISITINLMPSQICNTSESGNYYYVWLVDYWLI